MLSCPLESQKTFKGEQISKSHGHQVFFTVISQCWWQSANNWGSFQKFSTSGKGVWLLQALRIFLMANVWSGKQAKPAEENTSLGNSWKQSCDTWILRFLIPVQHSMSSRSLKNRMCQINVRAGEGSGVFWFFGWVIFFFFFPFPRSIIPIT